MSFQKTAYHTTTRRTLLFLTFSLGLVISRPLSGAPLTFTIKPGNENRITFTSRAPLGAFTGGTDQIRGTIRFDPDDLTQGAEATITADLAYMDTGNKARNIKMQEKHLETSVYPEAHFVFSHFGPLPVKSLPPGKSIRFTISGKLTCHGVEREISPVVDASWNEDNGLGSLEVVASFEMLLSDYGIVRPTFLTMKLDEKQEIVVRFTALTTDGSASGEK